MTPSTRLVRLCRALFETLRERPPDGWSAFLLFQKEKRVMPTARKEAAVQELRTRLADAKSLFLTDFAGLTVDEITKLRGQLRKDGNTYAVVKNTLFSIAAGDELASKLEAISRRARPASSLPEPTPSHQRRHSSSSPTTQEARDQGCLHRRSSRRRQAGRRACDRSRPRPNSSRGWSVRSLVRCAVS